MYISGTTISFVANENFKSNRINFTNDSNSPFTFRGAGLVMEYRARQDAALDTATASMFTYNQSQGYLTSQLRFFQKVTPGEVLVQFVFVEYGRGATIWYHHQPMNQPHKDNFGIWLGIRDGVFILERYLCRVNNELVTV
jgi:hypothetical protein